ncbi:MAG: cold shock domain-containing protein [Verrucomicrobiaceae bacterium]|nr:cold shock domain-containing protein [Verrucomicrobiaceae bacterium]
MEQGTIKKIISDKGFGFIADERKDLFFHRSSVEGTSFEELYEGQSVEFTRGEGPKGPCAESVKPA